MPEPRKIDLPFPPSVNHYWRSTIVNKRLRVLISKKGRDYRAQVARFVGLGNKPFTGRVAIVVEAFPPDRRKRDLDNMLKALLDSMTHAGVWHDDDQIDEVMIVRRAATRGGMMRVVVSEIGPEA